MYSPRVAVTADQTADAASPECAKAGEHPSASACTPEYAETVRGHMAMALQRAVDRRVSGTVQRKPLTGFSEGVNTVGQAILTFSDGQANANRYWLITGLDAPDRAKLLAAIADKGAKIGAEVDAKVAGPGWNFQRADVNRADVAFFDPIILAVRGTYGPQGNKNAVEVHFHFGNSWAGYVVYVDDPAAGINNQSMRRDPNQALGPGEYTHIHDTAAPAARIEGQGTADSVTKLVGEGARFKCVKDNVGTIRNNSKIYTAANAKDEVTPKVRHVTFDVLWKSWSEEFGKGYGISDARVETALKKDTIDTTTGAGVVAVPVNAAADANTMSHAHDICVDNPKPDDQNALNLAAIRYLYFRATSSVTTSATTLAQRRTDLNQHLDGLEGVTTLGYTGYIGAKRFAALCTVEEDSELSAPDDYNELGDKHVTLSYPKYRESKAKVQAKAMGDGANIAKEAALLKAERTDEYQEEVAALKDIIEELEIPLRGANLDTWITEALMPWDQQGPNPTMDTVTDGMPNPNPSDEENKPYVTNLLNTYVDGKIDAAVDDLINADAHFYARSPVKQKEKRSAFRTQAKQALGLEDPAEDEDD